MKKEKPENAITSGVKAHTHTKKSMFHFSPLFGFIFPAWPFATGEGGEKWDAARRRVGKKEITHIRKNSEVKTHLILRQNLFEQQ